MLNKISGTALLVAGLLALAGCQEIEKTVPTGRYSLTLQATKGAGTKSLELSGNTLNAKWVSGEQVAVCLESTVLGYLTVTAVSDDKATLSGTVSSISGIQGGAVLTLVYPRMGWEYSGQDGTLKYVSDNCDYAIANVEISEVNGSTVTTTADADFINQQSIFNFSFSSNDNTLGVKSLTISSEQNKLVSSCSYSTDWQSTYGDILVSANGAKSVYVAIRNENLDADDSFSFDLVDSNSQTYLGSKSISAANLGYGKFLSASGITMNQVNIAKIPGKQITDEGCIL